MRDTTERPEGIEAGTAKLVGTNKQAIISEAFKLLDDQEYYEDMAKAHNPFGDGRASERISRIIAKSLMIESSDKPH